jgi:hypothetical protein
VKLVENKLRAQELEFSVEGAITDLSGVPRVHLTLDNPGFETRPIFELLSSAGLVSKELAVSGPMGLRVALTGPSHSLASALNAELKDIKVSDKRAFDGAVTGQILLALPLGGQAPPVQTLSGSGIARASNRVDNLLDADLIEAGRLSPPRPASAAADGSTLLTALSLSRWSVFPEGAQARTG